MWARTFAERFPEVIEVHLVGSRATGNATSESDYDFIVLVDGSGTLRLSEFETIPKNEPAWGWLLPEDSARLLLGPTRCDVMLVDTTTDEVRAVGGVVFLDSDPHVLLWRRSESV